MNPQNDHPAGFAKYAFFALGVIMLAMVPRVLGLGIWLAAATLAIGMVAGLVAAAFRGRAEDRIPPGLEPPPHLEGYLLRLWGEAARGRISQIRLHGLVADEPAFRVFLGAEPEDTGGWSAGGRNFTPTGGSEPCPFG